MKTLEGIWLDREDRATLQEQIVRQLKGLIRGGALRPQEMLPSTRELADQLQISRNTVVYAYDRLVSEGYAGSRPRSGIFVSGSLALTQRSREIITSSQRKALDAEAAFVTALRTPTPFRPSQPDVTLFPLSIWNQLRGQALRQCGHDLLHYQASCVSGFPALRQRIAQYLQIRRGVRCDWQQIVITAGSQQALYLLGNLLVPHYGTRVYMEDPGYLGARLAWRNGGAKIVPGPLDEAGLQVPGDEVRDLALIYTTPSRQFPTGVSLSLPRRVAILDFAARNKTWVIEDDYDAELRYDARPLPSLQGLDENGRVIYVGTFSKVLFPSLRVGYVVVPPALFERFRERKHLVDDHGPLIDQATLALFLESGAFHSHIRRCRKTYAERQKYFLDQVHRCGLPLEFRSTDGGMNLLGHLPHDSDDRAWSARLSRGGLDIPPLSSYSLKAKVPGLVFGFTAHHPQRIKAALDAIVKLAGHKSADLYLKT